MSKYVLRHDEASCIGCLACEVHCKTNKHLGPGPNPCKLIAFDPVDVDGLPRQRFVFMPCFHCEDPWCVRACPTGAMQKREKDGIVFVESSLCIGCKSCIAACPWGTPQWDPDTNKVVKCDYCMDRVDAGLQPACVTKCVTGCLSFGVANEAPDPRRERYARHLLAEPPVGDDGPAVSELQPLPTWLDAGAAALAGAEPPAQTLAAALPGLARAQSLTPMQRLQRVRESGLAESSGAGEPVALAWRRFLRGHGPSVLVIDATGLDVRARGTAAVLDGAPRLLVEGVLIAAGLRDSRTVELRLPAELTGHEAAFLNAVDAIRSLAAGLHAPHAARGAARQPAELLGGGTGRRRVTAGPHAGDLGSYRPAVRRRARPRCVVAHAPARHEAARPGRARTVRQPAEPDRRLGRRRGGRSRRRARLRRRSGRLPAAVRGGPLRAIPCRSRSPASSRRRPA